MLRHRFQIGPGAEETREAIDLQMEELGYDPAVTTTWGYSPAAIGTVLRNGDQLRIDRWRDEAFDYEDYTGYFAMNLPLGL